MEIRERSAGEVAVLDLAGRMVLDEGGSDRQLRDRMVELISLGRRHVVLTLAQVSQADTSGLTTLVAVHAILARCGGRLVVAAPRARIRELLRVTRLDRLVELFDTEAEAVDALLRSRAGSPRTAARGTCVPEAGVSGELAALAV